MPRTLCFLWTLRPPTGLSRTQRSRTPQQSARQTLRAAPQMRPTPNRWTERMRAPSTAQRTPASCRGPMGMSALTTIYRTAPRRSFTVASRKSRTSMLALGLHRTRRPRCTRPAPARFTATKPSSPTRTAPCQRSSNTSCSSVETSFSRVRPSSGAMWERTGFRPW